MTFEITTYSNDEYVFNIGKNYSVDYDDCEINTANEIFMRVHAYRKLEK